MIGKERKQGEGNKRWTVFIEFIVQKTWASSSCTDWSTILIQLQYWKEITEPTDLALSLYILAESEWDRNIWLLGVVGIAGSRRETWNGFKELQSSEQQCGILEQTIWSNDYRRGNWYTNSLSDLLKIARLVSGRTGNKTKVFWLPTLSSSQD